MSAENLKIITPDGETTLDQVINDSVLHGAVNTGFRYSQSEIGSGYLFADFYKSIARYVPERKQWFIYSNGTWKPNNGMAMELCKELANAVYNYAYTLIPGDAENKYRKYAATWLSRRNRETILKDAASVYPISLTEFDRDPYLFNCLNGTLDLVSMTFHDHNPDDLLTMMSGVVYDPTARCTRWEQHVREIMCNNLETVKYLQKSLGYALTGSTKYESFMVLFGPTSRNGKGVTMETYMKLVGDYGCSAKPDTITQKQTANSSGPCEDIARLAGKRFVNISEPDKNMVLSSALVKTLTGNDKITARFLNENSFEFHPRFKLYINTNYLPKVTDRTLFDSGRVKVIMFNRHFEPHEQDRGLKDELAKPENLSGILNWCIEGWQLLCQTGFDEPQAVKDAVEAYREDSDKIGQFLREMMVEDSRGEAPMMDTYDVYRQWCDANGMKAESMSNFKKSLLGRATLKRKRPAGAGRSANPVSVICGWKLIRQVNLPNQGNAHSPEASVVGERDYPNLADISCPSDDNVSANTGNHVGGITV